MVKVGDKVRGRPGFVAVGCVIEPDIIYACIETRERPAGCGIQDFRLAGQRPEREREMKLPIPSRVGQENVLDFSVARAKASPELKSRVLLQSQLEGSLAILDDKSSTEQVRQADRFATMILRGIAGLSQCHADGVSGALQWVKRAVADLESGR